MEIQLLHMKNLKKKYWEGRGKSLRRREIFLNESSALNGKKSFSLILRGNSSHVDHTEFHSAFEVGQYCTTYFTAEETEAQILTLS